MQRTFPTVPEPEARALMEAAHQICPYSRATRGNIPVTLEVVTADSALQAAGGGQHAE